MHLETLNLTNFKNHISEIFHFRPGINCIIGKNGVGKTNILDSIYYLAFTKSAISANDKIAIKHGADTSTIFGSFDVHSVAVQIEKGKSKLLKLDKAEVEKISNFIGKIPLVMILPDDSELIKEGSEIRRKFFDGALSQIDNQYLINLLEYNRLLKQRNSLLKQSDGAVNRSLLETYDDQIIPVAKKISKRRNELVSLFQPFLEKNYLNLHLGSEVPKMVFISHVDTDFEKTFKASLEKDLIMQRSLVGSHRDDVSFILDGEPIKKFGSQGQQKTFVISLKLALYDYLMTKKGEKPILLLDDIFDKLDDSRIQSLVEILMDQKRFGQVFITDARKDRSKELLKGGSMVNFIELN